MTENNDVQKSDKQKMLITKESLRPPCKRQRTRSTATCITQHGKEDIPKGKEDIPKGNFFCFSCN